MATKQQYRGIIRTATLAAGAIGVPGALSFGTDVTAMTGIWVTMIVSIANRSHHPIDRVFATKLATGVLAGVGAYIGGSKVLTNLLHFIPGVGTLTAMGVNGLLNAFYTYKLGSALAKLFDTGSFSFDNVAAAATMVLGLVNCLPSPAEIADMVGVVTG